ncbi:MAG: DNA-binding MarR family transcriptional regulator [Paracoccaceae bacterium]|jgi:DNA-binding MarR family transcriptional regulator
MAKSKTNAESGGSLTSLWERPGYLIRRLHQIHVAIFLDECADYGITPVQYAVMTALLNNPGADQVTLARDAGIDRTNVADVLARLAQRGLVKREAGKQDRRMRVANLTEEGEKIARDMEHASLSAQARFMAPLSADKREQLMSLMGDLVDANNEFSRAPARKRPAP